MARSEESLDRQRQQQAAAELLRSSHREEQDGQHQQHQQQQGTGHFWKEILWKEILVYIGLYPIVSNACSFTLFYSACYLWKLL